MNYSLSSPCDGRLKRCSWIALLLIVPNSVHHEKTTWLDFIGWMQRTKKR